MSIASVAAPSPVTLLISHPPVTVFGPQYKADVVVKIWSGETYSIIQRYDSDFSRLEGDLGPLVGEMTIPVQWAPRTTALPGQPVREDVVAQVQLGFQHTARQKVTLITMHMADMMIRGFVFRPALMPMDGVPLDQQNQIFNVAIEIPVINPLLETPVDDGTVVPIRPRLH